MENPAFHNEILDVLMELGVNPSIKGFDYLMTGITLAYEKPEVFSRMTKDFYPSIAQKHDTTSSRVERAIRHAVETAFNNMPCSVQVKYFGNCVSSVSGKLTNSNFIAALVRYFEKSYPRNNGKGGRV